MTFEKIVLGFAIRADATRLDDGVHVLLYGGSRSHIGSVSVAAPEEPVRTLTFPGHYEKTVSEKWAQTLSKVCGCTATVVCGIHYDGLSSDGLALVVSSLGEMLGSVMKALLCAETKNADSSVGLDDASARHNDA